MLGGRLTRAVPFSSLVLPPLPPRPCPPAPTARAPGVHKFSPEGPRFYRRRAALLSPTIVRTLVRATENLTGSRPCFQNTHGRARGCVRKASLASVRGVVRKFASVSLGNSLSIVTLAVVCSRSGRGAAPGPTRDTAVALSELTLVAPDVHPPCRADSASAHGVQGHIDAAQ